MEKDEHDLSSKAKTSKKRVGMHVSTKGGLPCVFERTTELGGSAAAFFLKNQRTWKPPKLPDAEVIEEFARQMTKHGIDANCLLPHGNYLVNLCNGAEGEGELLAKSKECFLDEMKRCELLGIKMLNIHPGSTKGKISIEESCKVIADAINEAHSQVADVSVILEITAGGGNAVGKTFEELKMIIDGVTNTDRVGVCLDTCHMFAAGYDIRTQEAYDATMAQFEEVVGLKYLKAIHLNDSKAGLGSKVDRHENIGKGYVGLEAFRCLMNDDRMNGIPLVLETPEGAYREEVKLLYSLEGNTKPYPPAPDAPGKEKKKTTKKATATKRKKKESESDEDEEDEKKPKGRSAKKSTPRRTKTTNPRSEYDDDEDFQPLAPKKRRLAKRTKKPAARAKEEEEDSDQ